MHGSFLVKKINIKHGRNVHFLRRDLGRSIGWMDMYIILKNLIGRRSDLPAKGFTHSMPLSAPFPLVLKHTSAQHDQHWSQGT